MLFYRSEEVREKNSRLDGGSYLFCDLIERLILSRYSCRSTTPSSCAGTIHTDTYQQYQKKLNKILSLGGIIRAQFRFGLMTNQISLSSWCFACHKQEQNKESEWIWLLHTELLSITANEITFFCFVVIEESIIHRFQSVEVFHIKKGGRKQFFYERQLIMAILQSKTKEEKKRKMRKINFQLLLHRNRSAFRVAPKLERKSKKQQWGRQNDLEAKQQKRRSSETRHRKTEKKVFAHTFFDIFRNPFRLFIKLPRNLLPGCTSRKASTGWDSVECFAARKPDDLSIKVSCVDLQLPFVNKFFHQWTHPMGVLEAVTCRTWALCDFASKRMHKFDCCSLNISQFSTFQLSIGFGFFRC